MKMEISKIIQKSENNSPNINGENITLYNNTYYGITEERMCDIIEEKEKEIITKLTKECEKIVQNKITEFVNLYIPKHKLIEENFNSFSNPSFQTLFKNTMETLVCSDRKDDYKLLTELLLHRVKNKTDIKKKASISKAIEIVDKIDNDSLLALTIFHCIQYYTITAGDINKGINVLENEIYSKFPLEELPKDYLWRDNLEILNTVTVTYNNENLENFYAKVLSGYVCVGIKKDSNEYIKACEMLKNVLLSPETIVNHDLLKGYVRLDIAKKDDIKILHFNKNNEKIYLNNEQKECLYNIFDMYLKDKNLYNEVKNKFIILLHNHENIKKVCDWYNLLNINLNINSVGRVIAHIYAKSLNNNLPDLD